ncbi:CutC family protein [Deinococcus proteolyticus MRP]|uniref:PF03932 family protein CutC n=1 Tax=Deinococcus proteolyticus (strain ATCC 35074 / DSM 20540 / JCM 6276 / NBRC 101906 / NCIMB 13154 / VKM Ac-1939 / CCM 2703 / MRP) TaxID=693977 RepID=F0RP86_DEIPM|nr:copper homeostasis protein CutC [Deinococcus proteolyticus]ADY26429.1 CutC family protein [Deinococcus proteolyticus MRP]
MPDSLPVLEVCVDSLGSARSAVAGGADRLELCSALSSGGLTPSPALTRSVCALGVPVHVLIRTREGPFSYIPDEVEVMVEEIRDAAQAGAAGVVVGALDAGGRLDAAAMRRWAEIAAGAGIRAVCHRAFDLSTDLTGSLEQLQAWGYSGVLTSGGAPGALAGADRLRRLREQARPGFEVLAGGVRPEGLAELLRRSGVTAVHGSFSALWPAESPATSLGFDLRERRTDAEQVAQARRILRVAAASQVPATQPDQREE